MKIGYARVSTDDQNLDLQRAALEGAGCERVYEDRGVSGAAVTRPGLMAALKATGEGDTLVVWKIDRLGRSLPHLIKTVADLGDRGAHFASLTEAIDTTSAGGQLVFHMMASLAQFERALIVERTKAGMAAAKRAGRHVGRKPAMSPGQVQHARQLRAEKRSVSEICQLLGVSRATFYRHVGASVL